jgi:hypothetical protein
MNSIAAFQMVQALDGERLRRAEERRLARELRATTTEVPGARIASGNWRSILRFPRYTAAASKS